MTSIYKLFADKIDSIIHEGFSFKRHFEMYNYPRNNTRHYIPTTKKPKQTHSNIRQVYLVAYM